MTEERDLEMCNFQNFRSSVTLILTMDRVEVILTSILVEVYLHTKLDRNRKKTLQTDGRTDSHEFQFIRSSLGDDLWVMT